MSKVPGARQTSVRIFAASFAASLVLGVAWMTVIGPFRGMDEYDHAYRADSVSNGYWAARPNGGVVVDDDLVEAIDPVCRARRGSEQDCRPSPSEDAGRVRVDSTAGAYHPAFYWVVGGLSSPFEGNGRLYAMRALLVVLNSALFGAAFLVARRCFSSTWPAWGVALTATPQAAAASMVVAPNGLESSCSVLLWMCLLAAVHGQPDASWRRALPWACLVLGLVIGTVRSLGPLWLACIFLGVVLTAWSGRQPRDRLLSRPPDLRGRAWTVCAVGWSLASLAGLAWALASGTNSLAATDDTATLVTSSASDVTGSGSAPWLMPFVWVFQIVGALPYRDEPLPLLLYAVTLITWLVVVARWTRTAPRDFRRAAGAVVVMSFAVPIAFSLLTGEGSLWQGRYCWPLAMGVFLVLAVGAGLREEPSGLRRRSWPTAQVTITVLVLTATASWALLHVLSAEQVANPVSESSSWWTPPAVLVALLPVLSAGLLVVAGTLRTPPVPSPTKTGLPVAASDVADGAHG